MSDNPYKVVREETHEVVYKDGSKRTQRTGWDSQGRVVQSFSDYYMPDGTHSSSGVVVEDDGKWHGGGMLTGPIGEYITDSIIMPHDFNPKAM